MPEVKNFIAIGKIVKTIGIKGNLKIIPLTDFPERYNDLRKAILYDEKENKFFKNSDFGSYDFEVSECKVLKDYINLKFQNFNSIESARELIDKVLMIDEKHRIRLEEGSYYLYELVDADVFNKGENIGKVISLLNYGSGDLFNVRYKEKEILIPFRDEFVKSVDIEKKRIDVDLIDGFLD
ncbi:MAG: ribosome maturation factor RimM [Bacteroidota bacterium]|nr:ribosome maturation factor RimM [Bacteroidota bacterium]